MKTKMILLMRINLKPVVNLLQNRTLKSIEHQRRKIRGVILKVSDQVMMQFRCKKCDWLEIWWLNSSLSVKLINIAITRNVPRHRYPLQVLSIDKKKVTWLKRWHFVANAVQSFKQRLNSFLTFHRISRDDPTDNIFISNLNLLGLAPTLVLILTIVVSIVL